LRLKLEVVTKSDWFVGAQTQSSSLEGELLPFSVSHFRGALQNRNPCVRNGPLSFGAPDRFERVTFAFGEQRI
jgi:hypothetical protein